MDIDHENTDEPIIININLWCVDLHADSTKHIAS